MTTITVDCLGLSCPIPVVRLAKAVAAVHSSTGGRSNASIA